MSVCSASGAQTPCSVTMPAMSDAGVTSKAGLATGVSAGSTATLPGLPPWLMPQTWRSSSAARSSMGMPRPSAQEKSMVDRGAAT